MAIKSYKQTVNLTEEELVTKLREAKKTLFQCKIEHATGQLENTSSVWRVRKEVARMKFLLGQKKTAQKQEAERAKA